MVGVVGNLLLFCAMEQVLSLSAMSVMSVMNVMSVKKLAAQGGVGGVRPPERKRSPRQKKLMTEETHNIFCLSAVALTRPVSSEIPALPWRPWGRIPHRSVLPPMTHVCLEAAYAAYNFVELQTKQ